MLCDLTKLTISPISFENVYKILLIWDKTFKMEFLKRYVIQVKVLSL